MTLQSSNPFARWNLVQRFNVVTFIILILGTAVIGAWVSRRITASIINESSTTIALYFDSFVAPNLQELDQSETISSRSIEALNRPLQNTDLGKQIVSMKVWNKNGKVLYSIIPSLTGRTFLVADDLRTAWQGHVVAQISNLEDDENLEEKKLYNQLLEIYVPIRLNGTHKVIAVAEFYVKANILEAEITQAYQKSWFVVSAGMGIIYLLLVGFFQWTRKRIERQEDALSNQVALLTEVLSQNEELDLRVRRAVANTATLNERMLHRISIDLTEGPAQEIDTALIHLKKAVSENKICRLTKPNSSCNENLPLVRKSLENSMQEISVIANGLWLPHLEGLTLPEVFINVVQAHKMRTGTEVAFEMRGLPDQAAMPIKVTSYRIVQESLTNGHRHANGTDQKVKAVVDGNELQIEVSDQGPGFDPSHSSREEGHLGLVGMRERVESLGGIFSIDSKPNEGTKIFVHLFLQEQRLATARQDIQN